MLLEAAGDEPGEKVIERCREAHRGRGRRMREKVGEKRAEEDAPGENLCLHEAMTDPVVDLAEIFRSIANRSNSRCPAGVAS